LLTRNKKTKNITAVATSQVFSVKGKGKKVKVRELDIVPLHETPPQKHSGMAHVLKGSQFYLHTPSSSAIGMSHTCLCLPSYSWYSSTDPRDGRLSWLFW